jgi:hypothetical protein
MVLGLWGTVQPLLPGLPLIWTGVFLFSFLTDFEKVSLKIIIIFGFLTLLAYLLDYLFQFWALFRKKASLRGVAGSLIGLLVGFITGQMGIIIVGILLGALLGEISKELIPNRNKNFWHINPFKFLSFPLLKFVLGLIMISFFLFKVLINPE